MCRTEREIWQPHELTVGGGGERSRRRLFSSFSAVDAFYGIIAAAETNASPDLHSRPKTTIGA
jgi:hypothetical protein